jgi:hypothetical protein
MPIFLYGVGALAFAIGVASIGFGIPNNEFGIGNTLIVAGVTAVAGGLIVIGLGVVVAQLQRIAEALGTRAPVRASRQFEPFEPGAAQPQAGAGRVPFPPRPKSEAKPDAKPESRPEPAAEAAPRDQFAPESRMEPSPAAPIKERASDYFAPHLPNPDEPPVTVADEVYLSPLHPAAPPQPAFFRSPEPAAFRAPEPAADRDEHVTPPPARPPHTSFDAMWPAEPKAQEPKPAEPKPTEFLWSEARRGEQNLGKAQPTNQPINQPPADDDMPEAVTGHQPGDAAEPPEDEEPRAVAILKSGVVDGMGYTLYVDGSIEAELPQGTLRFASINELRSHLEKTS